MDSKTPVKISINPKQATLALIDLLYGIPIFTITETIIYFHKCTNIIFENKLIGLLFFISILILGIILIKFIIPITPILTILKIFFRYTYKELLISKQKNIH